MEKMSLEEKAEALRNMMLSRGWQDVLTPALEAVIAQTTNEVMTGARTKEDEGLSDEALKQRAGAFNWVLSWKKRYRDIAQQLEQLETIRNQTEPAEDNLV